MKNLLSLLLLVVAFEFGCSKESPKPVAQQAVDVTTAVVEARDVPDVYQSVGTVEAKREAVLSAKIMGAITAFHVDEGSVVKKGDVLLTIDAADIAAKRREAVQAKAEGDAGLKEAEAALVNTDINYERISNLYKEQAVTKKELDDMEAQHKMAAARVEQVKARIAQAEANITQADVLLGYSVIRSPINGVVSAKMANVGEMAAPGRPLARVVDGSSLRLLVTVKENEVRAIKKGDAVKVTVDALPGRDLSGRITDVLPAADPATRSFDVKVDLPAVPGLKPGMFGRAWLSAGTRRAVLLPKPALVDKEGMQGAYVVAEDGKLRFQAVRLGSEIDGGMEVLSGISGGERVAVGDTGKLHEGTKIISR